MFVITGFMSIFFLLCYISSWNRNRKNIFKRRDKLSKTERNEFFSEITKKMSQTKCFKQEKTTKTKIFVQHPVFGRTSSNLGRDLEVGKRLSRFNF